jgi:predicted RNA-binding Zn ribbon-like protein
MNEIKPFPTLDIATYLDAPDVLSAGKLCLEFANTNYWHAAEHPVETLNSYTELVDWAVSVGIRSEESARELKVQATNHPALAEQVYAWAIELREAIYRIFVAIAEHNPVSQDDLALLNEALPHAFTLPELAATGDGFGVRWRGDDSGLDGILWPILRSAVRLLTDGEHNRIGQCADDRGCGYLFYDTSRNRSRRWCDMGSCGNRAKSQRHYARHRTPATVRK